MPRHRWKEVERILSRWIPTGKRQPSRGVPEADVISDEAKLTFEVKYRSEKQFPNWILDAFNQSALNKRLYPSHENFVAFVVGFGKGIPMRWFIAKEVDPKSDKWDAIQAQLADAVYDVQEDIQGEV